MCNLTSSNWTWLVWWASPPAVLQKQVSEGFPRHIFLWTCFKFNNANSACYFFFLIGDRLSEKKQEFSTTKKLAYGTYTPAWVECVLRKCKLQICLICGTKAGNVCFRGNCKIVFPSGIWANDYVVWVMHRCNPCGKLRGWRKCQCYWLRLGKH